MGDDRDVFKARVNDIIVPDECSVLCHGLAVGHYCASLRVPVEVRVHHQYGDVKRSAKIDEWEH